MLHSVATTPSFLLNIYVSLTEIMYRLILILIMATVQCKMAVSTAILQFEDRGFQCSTCLADFYTFVFVVLSIF